MNITTQELEKMRSVDIGAVDAEALPDVGSLSLRPSHSREERLARFLQAGGNPYCFSIGGVGVKIEFAEGGPSLQDALADFLIRAKGGL